MPFANNMIPASMITPFATAVQALMPTPSNSNLTQNYNGYNLGQRLTKLPSVKIDQALGAKGKISFYWGLTGTESQFSSPNGNADGLPNLITGARGTFIHSLTERLNYDYTITSTLLLHAGAGYSRTLFVDTSPYTKTGGMFDCTSIDIVGCDVSYNFPTINSTVSNLAASTLGGMQQMGNALAHTETTTLRPSFNLNTTWIRGSHTYKFGGEVWFQGNITQPPSGAGMNFGCSVSLTCAATNLGATALPYTVPAGLGGQQMGNFYANFLLGDAIQTTQYAVQGPRMGKSQWAVFAQDSWKVTRKLTIDYGLRWDLATPTRENYGRSSDLGVNTPNPAVGGIVGAPIFQQTCNCNFMKTYGDAFGPRLGVAYQLDQKTVLRGGWGIAYGFAPDINASSQAQLVSTAVGTNAYTNYTSPNFLPQPTWPNFSPGQSPLPGQIVGFTGLSFIDPNAARPPRQNQFSVGFQREISRDFVVDASYVGNRGVWWPGPLGVINQVSPQIFAHYGLSPYTNAADNLLLSQPLSSAAVIAKVGNILPYPGYATSNTLLNALRPYPQFSTITVTNSPTGKTWYDSMQVKATKRMSRGLQVNSAFTWSKAQVFTREDIYNPTSSNKSIQATDQPFYWTTNILYQTQKYFNSRFWTILTKDWQVGALLTYAAGMPLAPPASTATNNLGASEQIPTGQPFFLKNPNCGCINPYFDQVLNPAAWTNPAPGQYGPGPTTLYYSSYRQARRPSENFNFGRNFRIKESMVFSIRAEFTNIFNRTQIGNPVTSNPAGGLTRNPSGYLTGGFGVINLVEAVNVAPSTTANGVVGALYAAPRQGTLIARFTF
jgi:TonB dependent receptor